MRTAAKVCLVIIPVLALLIYMMIGTLNQPAPSNPPTPQQKEVMVTLQDLTIPLPEGWIGDTGDGFSYATSLPCAGATCNGIMVFGLQALANGDWQQAVRDKYKCVSNPRETAAAFRSQDSVMVGGRGAYYYTVALCGVSGTEKLGIYQTQIPPRVVVVRQDELPDGAKRLERAVWEK